MSQVVEDADRAPERKVGIRYCNIERLVAKYAEVLQITITRGLEDVTAY